MQKCNFLFSSIMDISWSKVLQSHEVNSKHRSAHGEGVFDVFSGLITGTTFGSCSVDTRGHIPEHART